jgi:hypothetical protein
MSKVDWITWKTDSSEIINPAKLTDKINDLYTDFNSYMNPVIYENIKYETINGGLDKSSINIMGSTPANEMAINILNNIDEMKSTLENIKLHVENLASEQKEIEKNQLINAIEEKIEEEKSSSKETTNKRIKSLEARLELAKTL